MANNINPLQEAVFLEYQKRIEAHFKATDTRIDSNEKVRRSEQEGLDKALKLQRDLSEEKLKIQALEYERRLSELNHAHEAAVKEQARVLPREIFESFNRDYGIWRDSINTTITKLNELEIKSKTTLSSLEFLQKNFDTFKITTATENAIKYTRLMTWGAATGVMLILLQIALNWIKK